MKNVIFIATVAAALTACASLPAESPTSQPQQAAPANPVTTPAAAEADAKAAVAANANQAKDDDTDAAQQLMRDKVDDELPQIPLTSELVYKLLGVEIAQQRGEWQTAYITLFHLAQQTLDPRLAQRAMEIAHRAKQPGEALAAARLWRKLAPKSKEATQYYLNFIVLNDVLEEAKPLFAVRLKDAAPFERGLLMFQIQQLLARAKSKTAAFALLDELLLPYRAAFEAHLVLAQGAHLAGDAARAESEAKAALALQPHSELAVLTQAQVARDTQASLAILADFLVPHPNAREVRTAYARMLADHKQYARARKEFEKLLAQKPDDLSSLHALGIVCAQEQDLPAAEKYFVRYLQALEQRRLDERDTSQVLMILAQIALERNDNAAALKWLRQIEPRGGHHDGNFNTQLRRAQLIARSGDVDGARVLLKEINPSDAKNQAQVILAEAQILRDANQHTPAFKALEDGVKRFPNNTELLYDYAIAAERLNHLNIMETSLRQIIKLEPNNHNAYNALGYSFAERSVRLHEAFALIEKALKLMPDDPFILDSMGWVQFRLGHLQEAERLLRQAYQIRADADIAAHLGEVLWSKGQKEAAQKLWRDAHSKDPQNSTLKSTLARLNVNL